MTIKKRLYFLNKINKCNSIDDERDILQEYYNLKGIGLNLDILDSVYVHEKFIDFSGFIKSSSWRFL